MVSQPIQIQESDVRHIRYGYIGYDGYAELKANGSWDMFLNLQTTYPNGGWMYFKVNNDGYIQLSGSGNKVNIYEDTTRSGHLDVGSGSSSKTIYMRITMVMLGILRFIAHRLGS